jgi:uncharacterized membrane protein
MPYCSQCGTQVGAADAFCASCGSRQPAAPRPVRHNFLDQLSPRKASMLCYIPMVGWIASLVLLATDRFRAERTVRFHAFQGLYLFVAWLVIEQVIGPIFSTFSRVHIGQGLEAAIWVLWIFMLIKTAHQEFYSLPIIGELAEKSASEK